MTQDLPFEETHANQIEWLQSIASMLRVDVGLVDGPALLDLADKLEHIGPGTAPLTAFLVGLASAGGDDETVRAAMAKVATFAKVWPSNHNEADGLGEWLG